MMTDKCTVNPNDIVDKSLSEVLIVDYTKRSLCCIPSLLHNLLDDCNPMFDLNRDLIKEQKEITVIDQINISEIVNKIMDNSSKIKKLNTVQGNLFH